MKILRFFVLLQCFIPSIFAEEAEVAPATSSYISDIGNMLMTLLFLMAVVFGILYFLKRIMRSRIKYLNRSTAIKILERRVLNPKASLFLVDILGKAVVISESHGNIQLITEFPEGTDVQALMEQEFQEEEPPPFKKLLGRFFKNG